MLALFHPYGMGGMTWVGLVLEISPGHLGVGRIPMRFDAGTASYAQLRP
jgi:hypothetical protein